MIPILGKSIYDQANLSGSASTPSVSPLSGSIFIEPDRWQLICVPTRFGYWDTGSSALISDGSTVAQVKNYVIDQLEDKYGAGVVEVCNAYFGDDDAFRNYIPGTTPDVSTDNFPLAFEDAPASGNFEYTAFWIRSLHPSVMELKWTTAVAVAGSFVSADRWRILANEAFTYYAIKELEFLDINGINVVPAYPNLGSSASSNYSAIYDDLYAFDHGANSNEWVTQTGSGHWIEYNFQSDVPQLSPEIHSVRMTAPSIGNVPYTPRNFYIQYWDGFTWVTIHEVSGETAWSVDEVRSWTIQP